MSGPIARRYRAERNRLQALRQHAQSQGEVMQASAEDQAAALVTPTDATALALPIAATDQSRPSSTNRQSRVEPFEERRQSTLVYLLIVGGIFGCEAIINKKAFEVLTESDRSLWLIVSGIAIALIVDSHLLGRAWKRSEQERQALPMLIVLAVFALGAAATLGTMRYLSIDKTRQQQVRNLSAQSANLQEQLRTLDEARGGLQRRKALTPAQRQSLVIIRDRRASVKAGLISTRGLLRDASHPNPVDQATVVIPLFLFLNIFLIGVASALSHHHFEPAAEEAAARRRAERRGRRSQSMRNLFQRLRKSSEERKARRARTRLARDNAEIQERSQRAAADSRAARARAQSEAGTLAGAVLAIDGTLDELHRAYANACTETEQEYGTIVTRYWEAHDRQARRRAAKFDAAWSEASLKAVKSGGSVQEPPAEAKWRRPRIQELALPFQRPTELA